MERGSNRPAGIAMSKPWSARTSSRDPNYNPHSQSGLESSAREGSGLGGQAADAEPWWSSARRESDEPQDKGPRTASARSFPDGRSLKERQERRGSAMPLRRERDQRKGLRARPGERESLRKGDRRETESPEGEGETDAKATASLE
jgi:hypothetical protein